MTKGANNYIQKLDLINSKLDLILNKENTLMATLQNVVDAINAESTVDDSIIALLDGIVAELKFAQNSAGGIDPASLDAILTGIQANTTKIQAAITANTTPPAPVTPPVTPVTP